MKKNILTILTFVTLTLITTSCKDTAKEAVTTEAKEIVKELKVTSENYTIDAANSIIEWIGSKPTESHNGTLGIKSGALNLTGGAVSGGKVIIDMNAITVLDIPADKKGNGKLVGHLKNDDFFGVETHPTATFEVTGTSNAEGKTLLSGNLTLKGITHNVTFPITISNNEKNITLTSETFSIDRTKWGIKFKSKTFGELGDKFIKDNIELKVTLKAIKS